MWSVEQSTRSNRSGALMYKHILIPIDGSRLSLKALNKAVKLAKLARARLTIMHVAAAFDPMLYAEGYVAGADLLKECETAARTAGKEFLARAASAAQKAGVVCTTRLVTAREPHRAIIAEARNRNCDLIVMASHGRRGLSALVLGSETTKVLTHCRRQVLVVR
jgi:nucleotide-binding universal stress UspA family protein